MSSDDSAETCTEENSLKTIETAADSLFYVSISIVVILTLLRVFYTKLACFQFVGVHVVFFWM